jgi:hypothetical protein
MKGYLWASLVLFAVQIFSYAVLRPLGLYSRFWYADILLHIMAGAMFASLFIWLTRRSEFPIWLSLALSAMSAVFGSFLWELWEFGGWRLQGFEMPYYLPELGDTLGDMLAGLAGGVILFIFSRLKKR